jgi:sugar lactone lactonase YvrE
MSLTSDPICCAPTGDRCGEGVIWCSEQDSVYWTDINRFLIHRFDTVSCSVRSWLFDEPVTAVLLTDRQNTFAVVLGSKIILWNPLRDSRQVLGFSLGGWPAVRLNDAGVDPRGFLWVGSMHNNVNPDGSDAPVTTSCGALYRVDARGDALAFRDHLGIPNTLVWSFDHKQFYSGDTLANTIWKYEYDVATGSIGSPMLYFSGFSRGLPDGSAIDVQGYVWNCRWGGGCIVRVAPGGQVERVIEMPTRNVTNCTFGGKNLNVLYVTTAASPDDPGDRLAGSLFAIQTQVEGVPKGRFRIAGSSQVF